MRRPPSRNAAFCLLAAACLVLPACTANKPAADPVPPSDERTFSSRLHDELQIAKQDHARFYSPAGLGLLAAGVAGAAPIANSSADQDVRDWYQHRVHRDGLDPLADVFNYGGQGWVVVPVTLELMALNGRFGEDWRSDGGVLEWSDRCCRAIALGYPPVVSLYGILGAGRPASGDSHWQPFNHLHGVSGHTFIGAVPWMTAAAMTDEWYLKAPLYAGSLLTGWSRIHDDKHYLAQVALGWWIAFLSTQAVSGTQEERAWAVTPTLGPEGAGMALEVRY